MPHRLLAVLIGGLLLLPAGSALAAPANVTLRVEGAADTLVPRTTLTTDNRVVNKDGVAGHDCTGTSAAGALEIATAGDWGGTWSPGFATYSVERVRTEIHNFTTPDFFEVWVNNRSLSVGVCAFELQAGDDVLLIVGRCEFDPVTFACSNPPVLPLGLTVPSTVAPGVPFDVRVVRYASDGTPSPVAGATIEGSATAATTNVDGVAAVTIAGGGPAMLRASKPGSARSARESVCSTTGSDGQCGTAVAAVAAQVACETGGSDGRCGAPDRVGPDRVAPAIAVQGIRDGQRFARGKGPRRLRATVAPDPSGLLQVKFRLTRTDGARCQYYSGRRERFRVNRNTCGAASGFWFSVGDREDTSYLLPRPLPRGRYVFDVNVIDKAYNRDDVRRRGGNRIVFHVG